MKSAIRMAVLVLMAGASTGALAGDTSSYAASKDDSTQSTQSTQSTAATTGDSDDQDAGHGSGEPGRMSDERTTQDALRAYNQEQFLEQTWMASP